MSVDIWWLGAHKTGTTFLQKSLDLSQDALCAAKIDYLLLEEFRAKYTKPLLHGTGELEPGPKVMEGREGWTRLIFDENILGLVQHVLSKRGQYLDAADRIEVVADHLGISRPNLCLGIRSPVTFVPSLYSETIKSINLFDFRRFLRPSLEKLTWSPMVASVLRKFPDSTINIYLHEEVQGHERELLSRVTGLPKDSFTLLEHPERVGLSGRAIAELEKISATRNVTVKDRAVARNKFPRDHKNPSYRPWEKREIATLNEVYKSDIQNLKSLDRVNFISLKTTKES